MFNSYSVWGHATSILSHYFNGHKPAYYHPTCPDLSHITMQPETKLDFKRKCKKKKSYSMYASMPLHSKLLFKWTVMFKINNCWTYCP